MVQFNDVKDQKKWVVSLLNESAEMLNQLDDGDVEVFAEMYKAVYDVMDTWSQEDMFGTEGWDRENFFPEP